MAHGIFINYNKRGAEARRLHGEAPRNGPWWAGPFQETSTGFSVGRRAIMFTDWDTYLKYLDWVDETAKWFKSGAAVTGHSNPVGPTLG